MNRDNPRCIPQKVFLQVHSAAREGITCSCFFVRQQCNRVRYVSSPSRRQPRTGVTFEMKSYLASPETIWFRCFPPVLLLPGRQSFCPGSTEISLRWDKGLLSETVCSFRPIENFFDGMSSTFRPLRNCLAGMPSRNSNISLQTRPYGYRR